MRLSKINQEKLRSEVTQLLEGASLEKKIQLDKNILNEIIFDRDKVALDPEILRKLDLNEVIFDHISWCNVDLSGTNAKIDFRNAKNKTMYNCNFTQVDLSDAHLECMTKIQNSRFQSCHIDLNQIFKEKVYIWGCDFSGNDASKTVVDENFLRYHYWQNRFAHTNLQLQVNFTSDENAKEECAIMKKRLGAIIQDRRLDGCFLNGKRITTIEELEEDRKQAERRIEEYAKEIIEETKSAIQKQLKMK